MLIRLWDFFKRLLLKITGNNRGKYKDNYQQVQYKPLVLLNSEANKRQVTRLYVECQNNPVSY